MIRFRGDHAKPLAVAPEAADSATLVRIVVPLSEGQDRPAPPPPEDTP
jgi:hypothetical protein